MDHENQNSNNIEHIDEQELTKNISEIVLSFDAVSRLVLSGLTENVARNVLRKDNQAQGIKIIKDDEAISINIHLCVYYGNNIPQLSYDIQSKVKNFVESNYHFNVNTINISVVGIDRIRLKNE